MKIQTNYIRKITDGNIYPIHIIETAKEPQKKNFTNSEVNLISYSFHSELTESNAGFISEPIISSHKSVNQ